jgi:hypothetical protein
MLSGTNINSISSAVIFFISASYQHFIRSINSRAAKSDQMGQVAALLQTQLSHAPQ